jgi:hypothetical protein
LGLFPARAAAERSPIFPATPKGDTIRHVMGQSLDGFIAKWADSGAAERANKDSFLNELCDVLDVPRPDPTRNDPERDVYVFERKVHRRPRVLLDLDDDDESEERQPKPRPKSAPAATAWPKKLPEQIAAVRDLVARTADAWTLDKVCAAFKGAKKSDVEEVLESLEALGMLASYASRGARRWKSTRGAA